MSQIAIISREVVCLSKAGVAARIQAIRISRGMSQTELAKRIGVGRSTVAMWESGERSPNLDMLDTLADVLECCPSAIYEDEDASSDSETLELRGAMRRNPYMFELFTLVKDASVNDVKRIIGAAEAILKNYDE